MKKIVDAITMQETGTKPRAIGVCKRRTYTKQFKAEAVAQCLLPGASVSAIALSHDINANVVRRWLPPGTEPKLQAPILLPVTIESDVPMHSPVGAPLAIELNVDGATLHLLPGFAEQDLRNILNVLRSLS